jgi:hypothetical protein
MTRLTVRLPDRVHQGIEDIAQFQRESLNEQIVKAAEAYIQEFAAKVQAGEIKTTLPERGPGIKIAPPWKEGGALGWERFADKVQAYCNTKTKGKRRLI